jgi:hypothetical protein
MNGPQLRTELARLRAVAAQKRDAYKEIAHKLTVGYGDTRAIEVQTPVMWAEPRRHPAKAREATVEFAQALLADENLLLGPSENGSLRVFDLTLEREAEVRARDAQAAQDDADAFAAQHADLRRATEARMKTEAVRRAIEDGDAEGLVAALRGLPELPESRENTLTTDALTPQVAAADEPRSQAWKNEPEADGAAPVKEKPPVKSPKKTKPSPNTRRRKPVPSIAEIAERDKAKKAAREAKKRERATTVITADGPVRRAPVQTLTTT